MSDIWHKKTEQPEKKLYCTRLIVTKWGSVYDEKDIDSGAFIETDWAYLDDLLACEKELITTRKALETIRLHLMAAKGRFNFYDEYLVSGIDTPHARFIKEEIENALEQIEYITKAKEQQ